MLFIYSRDIQIIKMKLILKKLSLLSQATDEDYGMQKPDLPQALRLIDEMNDNVKQVSDVVGSMLQRVKTGEISTEFGLSFLEVKYHMLLNYLINLTYVVLRKCSGL